MPLGRCASVPGIAPGAGTCCCSGTGPLPGPGVISGLVPWASPPACWDTAADGGLSVRPAAPPSWTNLVTACASDSEPSGVVAFPASWEAAASSSEGADPGSVAACWTTGLRLCTAARPGS